MITEISKTGIERLRKFKEQDKLYKKRDKTLLNLLIKD
jgi:hypothetical protein